MNRRMDRTKLNIGAYILQPYARSEEHIKDVKESGTDFIVGMENDRAALDLFEKYNLGAVVTGVRPAWWGGDGDKAGQLSEINPIEKYKEASDNFIDHPAIWGIDMGDEPSALDFPYYGKVINKCNKWFPCQFPYLNLYPNYASVAVNNDVQTVNQLGTKTYKEHIEEYCKNVPLDYLCYDFYVYSCNVTKYYENLEIVTDACRKTGRSMWIVLQVNSVKEGVYLSENNLRFQAFSSMAFGAENIIWACYTAGWWYHNVLDTEGNKTEQYEKLKKVNFEIKALADEYMRYRNVDTHFIGFGESEDIKLCERKSIDSLNTGTFFDFKAENGEKLVIGQMVGRKNSNQALMVFAADDLEGTNTKSFYLTFKALEDANIMAYGINGAIPVLRQNDGSYKVKITTNEGLLITLK